MTINILKTYEKTSCPWLVSNTHLLVQHGSRAYGTNTESSDYDYKGICIPPKKYYLGNVNNFEQFVSSSPYDTVVYEIQKFFKLAIDANPTIIEVLHVDDKDLVHVSDIGETILENRDLFISKKVKHTFIGYAISQLNRIKLHKKWNDKEISHLPTREEFGLPAVPKIPKQHTDAAEAEIRKYLDKLSFDFMDHLDESIKQEIKSNITSTMANFKISKEDQWVGAARTIGLNDNLIEIMQKERAFAAKVKEYNDYQTWKATRNAKRFEDEQKYGYDCKHAYHLIRLCRMAEEILLTGKVIVKRPDREELLSIRNGAWTYEQVMEFATSMDEKLNSTYKESVIPHTPDRLKIDQILIDLIERSFK